MRTQNYMKNLLHLSLVWAFVLVGLSGLAHARKSVYLIANHHTGQFDAYGLAKDGTISNPKTYGLQCVSNPSGVVIWEELDDYNLPNRAYVFISSEGSNCMEIIDALTNTYVDCVCVAGATWIDGIAMDPTTSKVGDGQDKVLFAMERLSNVLYAMDWDPDAPALTVKPGFPVTLPTVSGAYGITVDSDRDIIYVADSNSGWVRGFDVATLTTAVTEVFTWQPTSYPIDIVVDEERNILYTTHPGGFCGPTFPGSGSGTLTCMYDIEADVEYTDPNCHTAMGVAVNQAKGYVYLTHGCAGAANHVSVWDTSTSPWTLIQTIPNVGTPAGIAVANVGVQSNPGIVIGTNIADEECVKRGPEIEVSTKYFYIDIPSQNLVPVNGVEVEVQLPDHLDFVSATGGGIYKPAPDHTVYWDVGTMQVGDEHLQTIVLKVSNSADYDKVLFISGEIRSEVPEEDWGYAETFVTTCPEPPCGCICDLNCDGICDEQDLIIFGASHGWGDWDCNEPGVECICDLIKDDKGTCDTLDGSVFREAYARPECRHYIYISKVSPSKVKCGEKLRLFGFNFGTNQQNSEVRMGSEKNAGHPALGKGRVLKRVRSWRDDRIVVKIPRKCKPALKAVWVEKNGKKSNYIKVKIMAP